MGHFGKGLLIKTKEFSVQSMYLIIAFLTHILFVIDSPGSLVSAGLLI